MALLGPAIASSSIPLSRMLKGLLFGAEPADPVTIAVSALLLIAVAAAAAWAPARGATAVDPMKALRGD
jgi:ABC-type lipoprotein release transport system permease subunit